jgi:hypothetical protein
MPQPSEGVQVAGPMQMPPAPAPAPTPSWTEQVGTIAGDENKLAQYIGNPDNPKEGINFAKQRLQELWKQTNETKTAEAKVNAAVQSGDLLPLMKEIKKQSSEGSYIKAYLFNRLGLTKLAEEEQQKLGAGMTYASAVGPTGERALINYDANGLPIRGFDSGGQQLTPEKLAEFASGAIGPQTKSFMLPSVHGTPVQRTNSEGQVETGLMMYDPALRQSYVQVGNTKLPTTGWTTMSQTPQSVYGAAGAKAQGEQAAQTGVQQPALPPMAGVTSALPAGPSPYQLPPSGTGEGMKAGGIRAEPTPTGTGVKLTTTPPPKAPPPKAPEKTAGGGAVVVQQPNESYASFQQRKKAAEEATAAAIQKQKELDLARQKPPEEAKGKNEAKDVNNQNMADQTYDMIKPISDLIKKSTGSGIGTSVDVVAGKLGASPQGAQAIAELEVLTAPILANVPRFEGSQSEYDVKLYQKFAGDFANGEKPIKTRLAALNGLITLMKKYDKANKNDWSFGGTKEQVVGRENKPAGQSSGTTSSGNKFKRVNE